MNFQSISRRNAILSSLGAAAALGTLERAIAQPGDRYLTFIVPQPAGNPTDVTARKAAPILQKTLGQPIVVENLAGAGGSIGMNKMMGSTGDGQVLVICSQTELILSPLSFASARYRPEDFRCVGLAAVMPWVLIARPDMSASAISQLLGPVRQSGSRSLTLGHNGIGSMIHLMGEQLAKKLKVEIEPIAYKGTPHLVQDLMGGQIDLTFLPIAGNTVSLIDSGKIKAIGLTSAAENPGLPKVMPLGKLSPILGDFLHSTWGGVFVPSRSSQAQVDRLHKAFMDVLNDPEMRSWATAAGMQLEAPRSLSRLEQFYKGEIKLYQALAKEVGLTRQ